MTTTEEDPSLNMTNTNSTDNDMHPNIPYMACEILVSVFAVIGNALVILVFYRERRLRRRTNYYIVSLAVADLLVGLLGIPFAILASMGLPKNLYACLFTVSLLVVLCTISIFCLVAVSVDRYWAILHPMGYSRNVRTKTAIAIIGVCWVSGTLVGFLPLLGWHRSSEHNDVVCLFTRVMDYNYLVFLYFATIIAPALLLAAFYAHIYRVVLKQLRQIVTMNPAGGGTMLRMLGAAQKREVKATQNLSIIVLFFIICWIPLYTINCVQAFCKDCTIPLVLVNFCIILSHANSAVNPLLYAYHLRDFREAMKNALCCLFGNKGENEGIDTQGGRFGSHNTLHHLGVNTPIRNNSIQSIQQVKIQQSYSDSTTLTTRISSIPPNSPLNTIIANMNNIHQSVTNLPLAEDNQQKRKRIWTLTEVSCEDDITSKPTGNGHTVTEEGSGGTGRVNSAFISDKVVIDCSEEDDDVFISESGINIADISEVVKESDITHCLQNINEQNKIIKTSSVSSISDKSQELPEVDMIDKSDIHDKVKLYPVCLKNKETIISRADAKRNYDPGYPTLDSEIVITSSACEESSKTLTSPKNINVSPLKSVNEFLFHSNDKKNSHIPEVSINNKCEHSTKITSEPNNVLDTYDLVQRNNISEKDQEKEKSCVNHDDDLS